MATEFNRDDAQLDRDRPPKRRVRPDPVIEHYMKDVDRTLLAENLALTVEQRLIKLMEHQRFAEELQRAGRARRD